MKIKICKALFILVSVFFLMQSCSSEVPVPDDLFSIAIMTNSDELKMPEISKADNILIDSIAGLSESQEYAKALKRLEKKILPFMNSWNKDVPNKAHNKKDSIEAFILKLSKQKEIRDEWNAYITSYKSFYKLIENLELTKSVKTALVMKVMTSLDN